jgi:hypothetical protein
VIKQGAYHLGAELAYSLNKTQRDLEKMHELNEKPQHYTPEKAFLLVFKHSITFTLLNGREGYSAEANYQGGINVYLPSWMTNHPRLVIHELIHVLINKLGIKNIPLPAALQRTNGDYGEAPIYNGFAGGQ